MDHTLILAAISVLLVAAFVRTTIGFGDGMIAMPLLALICGIRVATPLVALACIATAIMILLGTWRDADKKIITKLFLSSLLGLPFGILLLQTAPEALMKLVLAVLVTGCGIMNLSGFRFSLKEDRYGLIYITGALAGVLGGAYNIQGIPLVIYGMLMKWPPDKFRSILQCYFLGTSILIAAGHGLLGMWTQEVVRLYLYALPAIVAGILLGLWIKPRITEARYFRLANITFICFGLFLLVNSTIKLI